MTDCQPTTTRNETTDWNSINWTRMERIVRQTQGRISRAASSGDWSKVTELQRLLVNSFAAKVIATRDVTTNDGARTPGVDRELWETPAKKMVGALSLTKKEYQPKTAEESVHRQGQGRWKQTPTGNPNHQGQSHATPVCAIPGAGSRGYKRQMLIRFPEGPIGQGRRRTHLHRNGSVLPGRMGARS